MHGFNFNGLPQFGQSPQQDLYSQAFSQLNSSVPSPYGAFPQQQQQQQFQLPQGFNYAQLAAQFAAQPGVNNQQFTQFGNFGQQY